MFLFTYFQKMFSLSLLGIISHFKLLLYELFLLCYVTFLQVSTKLIQAVLKTNWRNNVIGNMYNYFLAELF